MKLVYRILLHMSWALSLLLAAWAVLFYDLPRPGGKL